MTLTKLEQNALDDILTHAGFLRPHKAVDGGRCYRLLDANFDPVRNYSVNMINKLKSKGVLKINDDNSIKK